MKTLFEIAICLIATLSLSVSARALVPEPNPYAAIVGANVFKLKSPPPIEPSPAPDRPLSRITLLGIVCLGPKQVMLKTTSGSPPKEKDYTLTERESADEIEILVINEQSGIVRLRNRGIDQALSLEKDGLKPGGAAMPVVSNPPPARRVPRPGGELNPPQPTSAEEQTIMLEIQRKLSATQVEQGLMPPLPSTPMTDK